MDRVEQILEALAERQHHLEGEHEKLLTAQVLLVESQRKLSEVVASVAAQQHNTEIALQNLAEQHEKTRALVQAVTEQQQHTDEKLNALIDVVDDIVRRKPPTA